MEIVLGKDLKAGDVIVYDSAKVVVVECTPGKGAGSFDFGEYVSLKVARSYQDIVDTVWTFAECPIVVIRDE